MGNTTNYAIPYPELSDAPDGAAQMRALAEKVDASIAAGLKWARFQTTTEQLLTASYVKYPFTSVTGNAAHLTSGSIVIDVAGTYSVNVHGWAYTNEAAAVIASANIWCPALTMGATARGNGSTGTAVPGPWPPMALTAGMTLDLQIAGTNAGAGAKFGYLYVGLIRIGP